MRKPLARHFARVCLPLTLALAASFASATVVTFDDLATDGFVPANYAGLDWSATVLEGHERLISAIVLGLVLGKPVGMVIFATFQAPVSGSCATTTRGRTSTTSAIETPENISGTL